MGNVWVLQQPGAVADAGVSAACCQCKQRMRSHSNLLSRAASLSLSVAAYCAATELKLRKLLLPPIDFSSIDCACKGALHFDSCQRVSDDTFGTIQKGKTTTGSQVNKLKCKMQAAPGQVSDTRSFIKCPAGCSSGDKPAARWIAPWQLNNVTKYLAGK